MNEYRFKFYMNAKHYITFETSKSSIHPHTWEIVLYIEQDISSFIEFTKIERNIDDYLSNYESKLLNEIFPFNTLNPTMENIGTVLHANISLILKNYGWKLNLLEISENPTRSYIIQNPTEIADIINLNYFDKKEFDIKSVPEIKEEKEEIKINFISRKSLKEKQRKQNNKKLRRKIFKNALRLIVAFILLIIILLI